MPHCPLAAFSALVETAAPRPRPIVPTASSIRFWGLARLPALWAAKAARSKALRADGADWTVYRCTALAELATWRAVKTTIFGA
jgi:hypothetical protein